MLKSVAAPQGEKIRSSRTSDAPDKGTSSSTSDALVKGVSSSKGKGMGKKTVENVDRAKSKTILGEPVKKKSSRTKKPGTVEAVAPSQITIHKQVEVKTKHPSSSRSCFLLVVNCSFGINFNPKLRREQRFCGVLLLWCSHEMMCEKDE